MLKLHSPLHRNAICPDLQAALMARIENLSAQVAVIGLGYVGLPLAMTCARSGFPVLGLDIDSEKVVTLNSGQSYIDAVSVAALQAQQAAGNFTASADMAQLAGADIIIICVPTPLTRHREPDLKYIEATCTTIARHLRQGQLVILESTTYPGTTEEVMVPILQSASHICGKDFFIGYSPEREDPGNARYQTHSIPKVVSGLGAPAARLTEAFYSRVVDRVVAVSAPRVAEAVKITENIFRAVNVALVNELKVIFARMDIDIWEVIDAAATKPFGFMPFYPGPGLGGHCIPIDPFYLTWRAREFGVPTRFIELAGEINVAMPHYVVGCLDEALDRSAGKALGRSRILILGAAYKKNVSDMRESPSLHLMEILMQRGSAVTYHDPHVPVIPETREHARLSGIASVPLTADVLAAQDAVLIATDHDAVDYALIAAYAPLIVDSRNAMARRGFTDAHIIKA